MSVLAQFGVVSDDLTTQVLKYPSVTPGRIAHIDSDFIAYIAGAQKKDEIDGTIPDRTLEERCKACVEIHKHYMRMVGAENYVAHLTPTGSNKGNRDDHAMTKPYQGNRSDKPKPIYVEPIREYIAKEMRSMQHTEQEADDGMCQANWTAHINGTPELSVIISRDKDLRMCVGYHWCWDEEQVGKTDAFGMIWIDRKKKPAKPKGWGTSWFWMQLLMGDVADNIAGLPSSAGDKKPKLVGAVAAYNFLKDCKNDWECYKVVRDLYTNSPHEFLNYRTQEPIKPHAAMLGDMRTLWMRRTRHENDVLMFLREVVDNGKAANKASANHADETT